MLVSCCLDESGANVGGNIPPSFTDCVTVSDRNTCSRINNSFPYCSTLSNTEAASFAGWSAGGMLLERAANELSATKLLRH